MSVDGAPTHLRRCSGNPCLHVAFDAAPPDLAPAATVVTQCQSWPVSVSDEIVISVRCFGADGQLINCCGHGLLAVACSWQQRLERDTLFLTMNDSAVFSWREGNITWLRFDVLPMRRHRVPDWVDLVFGARQLPIATALAGDERGYLVLQWPDGFDLSQLQRSTKGLAKYTERALICTSAQTEWGMGNIQLRYFAPQYGVDEDAATGSAMRILAEYWYPRFEQLSAYQCSEEGGWLLSRRTLTHIEVGGHCVSDASEGTYV